MSDNQTADADRLEMALERIAALASRCQKPESKPAPSTEVAARLDALIADIKAALGHDGA